MAADGQEAGHLHRVVINPKTKEVTHLVIHTGVVMTQDKVVPVDLVGVGEQERLMLRLYPDQLAQMPDFEETHYRAVNEEELARGQPSTPLVLPPAFYWYPPDPGTPIPPIVEPPYAKETKVNIPEGTVPLKDGAKVVARDGQDLGHVERVLTTPQTDRVTHFVISKGRLVKEQKLVPVEWVDQWDEDQVRLAVGIRTIQALPEYEPTPS